MFSLYKFLNRLSNGLTLHIQFNSKYFSTIKYYVRGRCVQDTLLTCMKFSKTKTFKNI